MALGSGGSFVARAVTPHLHSNAVVIGTFTGRKVSVAPAGDCTEIRVA
jgi:RNA 3'-terminal phosphate cyclase